MKKHIAALDGLRGFAALSVVISHIHLPITIPMFAILWNSLGAGSNGVQILFVLSGFLMAYLYPSLQYPLAYIQKRYTRIFPAFGTVVVFLWLTQLFKISNIFLEIFLLLLLAYLTHVGWKVIKSLQKRIPISTAIFYGFLLLQAVTFVVLLFLVPKVSLLQGKTFIHEFLTLIANMTLTMPFSIYTVRLSGVFWSLVPEVLFYLIYPFFVIPLIRLAQKGGFLITAMLVVGLTIVLFGLDTQLFSIASLLTMNIARSTGFIIGVIVGVLYKENHPLLQKMQHIFSKPILQLFIFGLFILMEWADGGIRASQSLTFSNYYFFFSSWLIGILLLIILTPQTLPQKLFSNKLLVFLGTISYSLYLTHLQIIQGLELLLLPIKIVLPSGVYIGLFILLSILVSVGIAWALFILVENLYFLGKNSEKKAIVQPQQVKAISFTPLYYGGIALAGCLIIFFAYSGIFSKSLLVERQYYDHSLLKVPNTLLSEKPILIPVSVKNANFSIVGLDLLYQLPGEAPKIPSEVIFQLFDNQKKLIFQSKINAHLLNATSHFQFGFPPIVDSVGKDYYIGLSLVRKGNEKILLHREDTGFLSMSVAPPGNKILSLLEVFINRVYFTLTSPSALTAVLFFLSLPILVIISNKRHSDYK